MTERSGQRRRSRSNRSQTKPSLMTESNRRLDSGVTETSARRPDLAPDEPTHSSELQRLVEQLQRSQADLQRTLAEERARGEELESANRELSALQQQAA